MLAERVQQLKTIIASNDGKNAADARFARRVDDLVRAVYDDIGEIRSLPTRALFDLFVIKVLYVGRGSRHADIIEYLGALLETNLDAAQLFPPDSEGNPRRMYYSDMLSAEQQPQSRENVFEQYRKYADNALFLSGVFHASTRRTRPGQPTPLRRTSSRGVDESYYVSTGKRMYRMSARHDHATCEHHAVTLDKLADHFEIYRDALQEMSERYLMGFDMDVIADRMLDAYNLYRETGDARHLADASRYGAILRIDRERFPAVFPNTTDAD